MPGRRRAVVATVAAIPAAAVGLWLAGRTPANLRRRTHRSEWDVLVEQGRRIYTRSFAQATD